MHVLLYTHSLVSDWNHGNAHFLRGVMRELQLRGHTVRALEPDGGWSRSNLVASEGHGPVEAFAETFPTLHSDSYGPDFPHEEHLSEADVVIVHEWTDPALVARLGRARRNGGRFTLVFHDTHHRAVSDAAGIADLTLADYDVILVFGETLRQRYLAQGWGRQVFTWHEAADLALFRPQPGVERERDLVWIGNWGDGEREAELAEFLIEPARQLGLTGTVHGVRYPDHALAALGTTALDYRGWVANAAVPQVFARHHMTVHVPRRPYVEALPGIPTIRMFEALACGIPLVSAPWPDAEGLFREGDYLKARDGAEMTRHLAALRSDEGFARSVAASGLETIRQRHSCGHRVDELLTILAHRGSDRVRRALSRQEAAQ